MDLNSFPYSCFGCAVLNGIESMGRWRGAGPARVWSGGAWQELALTATVAWASPGPQKL